MKKPYIIALDGGFPREKLLQQMDRDARFGTWFYSMPNSFIVYSTVDANAIDAYIKEQIGEKYRYFITEIVGLNSQGWMPRQHWEIIYHKGAEKFFELDFHGYYTEAGKLPEVSGVFCVYQCVYVPEENTVTLDGLLYVGAATNVRVGAQDASLKDLLKSDCESPKVFCYSFAPVSPNDLDRCVAALREMSTYKHKDEHRRPFAFNDTFIMTKGRNSGLKTSQLVEKQGDGKG